MARNSPIRLSPSWFGPRVRLGAAVSLLGIVAFLPVRWLGPVRSVAGPVEKIVAPAQHRLRETVTWVRGRGRDSSGASADVAELTKQRDQLRFSLLQAEEQIRELRRVVAEISHSSQFSTGETIKTVAAPVIGGPADLGSKVLTVKAGRSQGIEAGAVVVTRGVHLVGKVRTVGDRTCTILPITDDGNAKPINGVIMLDTDRRGPLCQLTPGRNGKLSGWVMNDPSLRDPVTAAAAPIEVGMTVRFGDTPDWPESARMLIIGRVSAIEPSPKQPQRQIVTVEPVYPPELATEVMIRQPIVESAAAGNEKGAAP
jgi:hypothetical protein